MKISLIALALLHVALAATNTPEVEPGFEHVTCGSAIKLTNEPTGHKLHSHGVAYGSGSGQQSVTGFPEADDTNSLWRVNAGFQKRCKRGEPVPCGSVIRLHHVNTDSYLHSHPHVSPLSQQQEVSCYNGNDSGDDWKVICLKSTDYWYREEPVRLVHVESGVFLSCSAGHRYGQPIPNQLEVAGSKLATKGANWIAQEGIYFANV